MRGHGHDEDDDSGHFRPDAWKVAWEATQDRAAPSPESKAAANWLVWAEMLQQATGWVMLTVIGFLLGSFGQFLPAGVCLLSLAIFMVEAMLKFFRMWVHRSYFMDVPCAYVMLHDARHDKLVNFRRLLMIFTVVETVLLKAPYFVFGGKFLVDTRLCFGDERKRSHYASDHCDPLGSDVTVYIVLICAVPVMIHVMMSLVTFYRFDSAMGVGRLRLDLRNRLRRGRRLKRSRLLGLWRSDRMSGDRKNEFETERILRLTWWVHTARHAHLSAVVASAQADRCGLPGHWFEDTAELKTIVKNSVDDRDSHLLDFTGPVGMCLKMGLGALVSLAKQGQSRAKEILEDGGFDLLVRALREGKFAGCRGLAAAAIGILATQHEAIKETDVQLADAVIPLKRLARAKESELKEAALGALLNTMLNDEQFPQVMAHFRRTLSDGIIGPRGTFPIISLLMEQAHLGPTTRCQELAVGLLVRVAGDTEARGALVKILEEEALNSRNEGVGGMELVVGLLQQGLTTEIKASAAGLLAELAFHSGKRDRIGSGTNGELCIPALIEALREEPRIAHLSARALCNLALRFQENKKRIVDKGGIEVIVDLLVHHDGAEPQELVLAEAAKALWTLAFSNPTYQQRIAGANGGIAIPALVKLLENTEGKVQMQSAAALYGLAWKSKANQDLIGSHDGVFPSLVRLLSERCDPNMQEKVLEKTAQAISGIVDKSKSNQEKLLNAGALTCLENIERDGMHSQKTLRRVKEAIERLKENYN